MSLFRSLQYRSFVLLWSGQTVSRLGDGLYRVALVWWVLENTGSAVAMGTVLISTTLPLLFFLPLGGVAVDRFPRINLMLTSDLVRGLVVSLVALLAFEHRLEIWHICLAGIVFGSVNAFFQPAYTAVLPEIIPAEALPSANSLTSISAQLSGIIGPAVGATIVVLGGTAETFALDGLSFFASAACLLVIKHPTQLPGNNKTTAANLLNEAVEGIQMVAKSPWLWITITVAAFTNVSHGGPFSVTLPFLIKDNLHADVGLLGIVYSTASAGSILGAIWVGRSSRQRHRGLVAYGAWIISGLMTLLYGLPITVAGVLVVAFVDGITIGIFGLIWTTTLQEIVPGKLLGRVSSIDFLGSLVALPVGYGIAGWATALVGAPSVFITGGAVTMLAVGLGLLHPAIRQLD